MVLGEKVIRPLELANEGADEGSKRSKYGGANDGELLFFVFHTATAASFIPAFLSIVAEVNVLGTCQEHVPARVSLRN